MKHNFRAHLGRCSMLMGCNKGSSSQHHIMKCVRHSWTHHIFQVLFPSPRLPCSWGGGKGLLQPVDCVSSQEKHESQSPLFNLLSPAPGPWWLHVPDDAANTKQTLCKQEILRYCAKPLRHQGLSVTTAQPSLA